MPNMSLVKNPMPEQEPAVRATNFKEVALGYTREIAMEEADRCLRCKNSPCVTGCPVNVPIPDFIAKIKEGDPVGAYAVIRSQNALPGAKEASSADGHSEMPFTVTVTLVDQPPSALRSQARNVPLEVS